jgi:hypothetical protein
MNKKTNEGNQDLAKVKNTPLPLGFAFSVDIPKRSLDSLKTLGEELTQAKAQYDGALAQFRTVEGNFNKIKAAVQAKLETMAELLPELEGVDKNRIHLSKDLTQIWVQNLPEPKASETKLSAREQKAAAKKKK